MGRLNTLSGRFLSFVALGGSLLGHAMPTQPCDPALRLLILNGREHVVQEYADWASGLLEAPLKSFWQQRLGVAMKGQTEATLPYLSAKGVVLDALIALSSPGSNLRIQGKLPFAKQSEVLGRTINGKAPAELVLLDEATLRSLGRDRQQSLDKLQKIAGLDKTKPLPIVFVFRTWSPSSARSVLSNHLPGVVEVMTFPQRATHAHSDITVVMGNEALVQKLRQQRSFQSQFLGSSYRTALRAFLEKATPEAPVRVPREVHTGAERLGRLLDPQIDNASEHAPGFDYRDRQKTIDLGTADPNVQLDGHVLDRTQNTPAKERARLATAVKQWYADHYATKIDPKNLLFSDGAMGSLWQIITSLKPGSRLLIPDPGYYAYESMAKALGHRILRYPNFEGELALPPGDVAAQADALIVNFPHNPSGKILDKAQRERLQELAARGVLVINDLTFPEAAYDGNKVSSLLEGVKSQSGLLEIFGASKDLGLPEERIAALVGDPRWIEKLRAGAFEQQSSISAQRMSMFGAVLRHPELRISGPENLRLRRNAVIDAFREVGWPVDAMQVPEAGLNLMLKAPPGVGANEFATELWERAGVFVNPGDYLTDSVKAKDTHVRITLSESPEGLSHLRSLLDEARVRWNGFRSENIPRLLDRLRRETVRAPDGSVHRIEVVASPLQKFFDLNAVSTSTGERVPLWPGQHYYRSGDFAATALPLEASASPGHPGPLAVLPLFGEHLAVDSRLSVVSRPAAQGPRRWVVELSRRSKRKELLRWLKGTGEGRIFLDSLLLPGQSRVQALRAMPDSDAAIKRVTVGLFEAFSPEAESYFDSGFILDNYLQGVDHLRLNPDLAKRKQQWRNSLRQQLAEVPKFLSRTERTLLSPDVRLETLTRQIETRLGSTSTAGTAAYDPRVLRAMGWFGTQLERLNFEKERGLLLPEEAQELSSIAADLPPVFTLP